MKAKCKNFLLILVVPVIILACNENPKQAEERSAKTAEIPYEKVQVYRTIMPDAGPSAFAVRFNDAGLALCYDPVRGGINYAWKGDFDLEPTVTGKIPKPALVEGEPFYQEKEWHPLRTSKTADKPAYRFRGYSIKGGIPEFLYTIDGGMNIRERITVTNEGEIRRDFEVEGKNGLPNFLYLFVGPQSRATVSVGEGSSLDGDWAVFQGEPLKNFSVTIQDRKEEDL